MDSESYIDFEHLRRFVGDDPDLTAEVFGLFKNQVDLWSPQLRPELDDDSWMMMAHSLKGTARAIGATGLAEHCEKAEELVGEGKRPGARDVMVSKIESAISHIMIEIGRWEYRQTLKKMREE